MMLTYKVMGSLGRQSPGLQATCTSGKFVPVMSRQATHEKIDIWRENKRAWKYSIVPIMSCVKCFPFWWQGNGGHKVCSRQILWGVWEPTQRWEDGSVMGGQEGDPEVCSFPAVCGPWLDFDFPVELFSIFLGTIWSKLSAALGASRRGLGQDAGLSNPPDTLLQLNHALKRPWWGEGHGVP